MSDHDDLFHTDPRTGIRYRWNKLALTWDRAPTGDAAGCSSAFGGLVFLALVIDAVLRRLF